MALVTISDAAKLVRKARTTLMRDIENGRLNKTVLQDGDVRIDTAELLRAYGRLHHPEAADKPREPRRPSADKTRIALLEERIRSLERVITLEAELRRVKDQVTTELRTRLADKDHMIKILESKILFLEYDKQALQARSVPTLEPEQPAPTRPVPSAAPVQANPAASAEAESMAAPGTSSQFQDELRADHRTDHDSDLTPRSGQASSATAAEAHEKIRTWPASARQEQATSTASAPTTVKTAPSSPRAAPGAPGGIERRRPVTMRGWWKRLFSRGEPHNH